MTLAAWFKILYLRYAVFTPVYTMDATEAVVFNVIVGIVVILLFKYSVSFFVQLIQFVRIV